VGVEARVEADKAGFGRGRGGEVVRISIDVGGTTPHYEQIRQQIAAFVAAGELASGTRLPTVRMLASDLGIAAGTVARAYRELERSGTVVTRRRAGTLVTSTTRTPGRTREAARALVSLANAEEVTGGELLDIIRSELLVVSTVKAVT
jgi:GntR family transcriptional regulator